MSIEVHKIAELTGHTSPIYTLDKGTAEHLIFSGSGDKLIAEWNLKTFQSEKIITSFPAVIYAICHIPEKKLILAGTSNGNIHVFDLENNTDIKILEAHTAEVFNIIYSI